jgi:toxin CcdB
MPDQLDVHRNPGRNKSVIPFVVAVQSNQFREATRRVVVPLVAASAFGSPDSDVGPHFVIDGRSVVLDPLQITNIPRDLLGPAVASPTGEGDRVMRALDILLSRAWR